MRKAETSPGERGFGLIEIVISIFLLGLLAVAFLPLLITALQTNVRNANLATATQLVSQQMDQARTAGSTCSALTAFGASTPLPVSDARGTVYRPARAVANCPTNAPSYPTTVVVTVSVSMDGSSVPPVTATTQVYLRAP